MGQAVSGARSAEWLTLPPAAGLSADPHTAGTLPSHSPCRGLGFAGSHQPQGTGRLCRPSRLLQVTPDPLCWVPCWHCLGTAGDCADQP